MKIEIVSWDKYNPRKDLKSMPWFRLDNDIAYSEALFGLSPEQKWLWIFILSTCTKKVSGEISVNPTFFAYHSGVKEQNIIKHIEVFENRGLVTITNVSDRISTDSIENVPNERTNEHNEQDTNVRPKPLSFDFESIYLEYPKKRGKTRGMEKIKKQVTTQKDFDDFCLSVKNYAMINKNEDATYFLHFSTFAGQWRDFIEIDESQLPDKTPNETIVEYLKTQQEDVEDWSWNDWR